MILDWHILITSTNIKRDCISQNNSLCNKFNKYTNEHQRKQSVTSSAYQKFSIRLVMIHDYRQTALCE